MPATDAFQRAGRRGADGRSGRRAGIRPGDVITAVEDEAINAENDLATVIGQYAPGDRSASLSSIRRAARK
ncbi:MAG: PDZ domain-containing protein [Caldilineaceae bacterium]